MLVTTIFSFSYNIFKRLFPRLVKGLVSCCKGFKNKLHKGFNKVDSVGQRSTCTFCCCLILIYNVYKGNNNCERHGKEQARGLKPLPFLSILKSNINGSFVPSLFLPRPSPIFQPIFCSRNIPIPLVTGAALVKTSCQ